MERAKRSRVWKVKLDTIREDSWSVKEKEELLKALKKYGHTDIRSISSEFTSKAPYQIEHFINQWIKTAKSTLYHTTRGKVRKYLLDPEKAEKLRLKTIKKGKLNSLGRPKTNAQVLALKEKAAIDIWLQKLEEVLPKNAEETSIIAKMFFYISKFEKHPFPQKCAGIDFRVIYEFLYFMLSGYPYKDINSSTARVILGSINEMAAFLATQNVEEKNALLKAMYHVSLLNITNIRQYPGRKKLPVNRDDNYLRAKEIMKLQGFNPFAIPLETLKMI